MYGSFISATAKAAIIDPHPDGKFFVDHNGLEILHDGCLVVGVKQLKQNLVLSWTEFWKE